ncbi:hypothetical protein [Gloeocapsa sp. PCC 73106]|uniref:hypothetical protein n=1 Tax=Gloeocapsa sp. PCC 73106 TaxID=102232 RepID=UPI0002ACDC44|nr:hypothetical protein [Gloeocapsa sp. PCC 73106]ELR99385.1 hypothetical protein GLO73106DRAFT_00032360 [Gloeocapsa sp. PCC 73106]
MLYTDRKIENSNLLENLQQQGSLVIDSRQKNGLILYKQYHAEFAGPGALVGGTIDTDLVRLISVGNLALMAPQTAKERISGYLIRRQWNRLIKQITNHSDPLERGQLILNQFEHWFSAQTVEMIPDEAFALLVGVFPQTIRTVRLINMGFD